MKTGTLAPTALAIFVSAFALAQLLFKAATLVFGIIQLAEAVGNFHLSDKNLPALGPFRLVGFLFGKRRNRFGKRSDICRAVKRPSPRRIEAFARSSGKPSARRT